MFFEKAIPAEARDAFRRDALAGILGGVYAGAVFPFILFIARDRLGASIPMISLMTAAPFIGSMLALFYANFMEGRSKMPYLVWSQVIARALFVLTVFAVTPTSFALVVTAMHILGMLASPAYASILKEIYPDAHRGRIMAYIRVGMAASTFLATLLSGALLSGGPLPLLGWNLPTVEFRYIFPIAGLIGVASPLIFSTIKTTPVDQSDPKNHRASTPRFLWNTLGILKEDRNYAWFGLSVFTFGFGNLLVAPLYPVFQVDRLNITATQVALLANTTTVVWMISYFYWGKYVDLKSPLRAVVMNVLLVSLVPLNYFLATDVWMLFPAAVITGITMGGTELAYFNSILFFARKGRESQYQALHSFLLGIRGTTAPFVGALIISSFRANGIDIKFVFLIAMTLMLIGAGLQAVGVKQRYSMQTEVSEPEA